jgi:hypothetical protein
VLHTEQAGHELGRTEPGNGGEHAGEGGSPPGRLTHRRRPRRFGLGRRGRCMRHGRRRRVHEPILTPRTKDRASRRESVSVSSHPRRRKRQPDPPAPPSRYSATTISVSS